MDRWLASAKRGGVEGVERRVDDMRSGVLKKGCVSKDCKECFMHRFRIWSESRIMLMSK